MHVQAVSGDDEFLFSIYASARAEEMNLVDWNAAQKESFLQLQSRAQDRFYKENYEGVEYLVILFHDRPVGKLYIQRLPDEIRIMDIALLASFRKRGIGSALLHQVLEDAAKSNLPVTIHVERLNPALQLCERLGGRLEENKGIYFVGGSQPHNNLQPYLGLTFIIALIGIFPPRSRSLQANTLSPASFI